MRTVVACVLAVMGAMCGVRPSEHDFVACSSATEPNRRVEACSRILAFCELNSDGCAATLAWRGEAKEALGDWAGAQRDYEESLAIAPELGGTLLGLGRVHLAQDDLASAERYLNRAIEVNDSGIGRDLLGGHALKRGDYEEALSRYEDLLASQPDNPIGFFGRGLARLATGDERGHHDITHARAEWDGVDEHFGQRGLAAP